MKRYKPLFKEDILDGQVEGDYGKSLIREVKNKKEFDNIPNGNRGIIYDGKLFMTVNAKAVVVHDTLIYWLKSVGYMKRDIDNLVLRDQSLEYFLTVEKSKSKLYLGEGNKINEETKKLIKKHIDSIKSTHIPIAMVVI